MESCEERVWTKDDILVLIEAYRDCPELWSPTDPNYLNKPARVEAWNRIAMKLSWTKLECKKKIFDLLATYRRIKSMEKRLEATGEKLQKPWFAYEALRFLETRDATKVQDASFKISTVDTAAVDYVKMTKIVTFEREVITDILKTYKALRCLWDPKIVDYHNPFERSKAYNILLRKWRKIDPACTIDHVKSRLTNFRTCYSKHKRKVELSIKNGDEEIYTPTVWYFDLLQFIDEVDRCKTERRGMDWKKLEAEISIKGTPLERDYWTDFLQTYRQFRSLWNPTDSKYLDHDNRNEKYNILLEKWRKIEPEATMENLKKKLCNVRTTYRKERGKVEASRKRGDSKIYTPTLWYFNIMNFLDEKDALEMGTRHNKREIPTNDENASNDTPSERIVITDVLKTYKKFRLLWDRNNENFTDKRKRNQALAILLKKWRKLYPKCTKKFMLNKMCGLRSVYRRQRCKVEESKKKGDEIVYTPTLWYFSLLQFLDEKDGLIPSAACNDAKDSSDLNECSDLNVSNDEDMLSNDEEPDTVGLDASVLSNEDITEEQPIEYQLNELQHSNTSVSPKLRRKRKLGDDRSCIASALDILKSTAKRLHTGNEPRQIQTFCSYIASKMCSYSASTQRGVQHAIYDILTEADQGISVQSAQHYSNSKNIKKEKESRPRTTFARVLGNESDQDYAEEDEEEPNSASESETENIHEAEEVWCIERYK